MNSNTRPGGLWFLNSHMSIGLAQADNEDGLSLVVHRMPFDDAPPLHVHHAEDEIFHIIDGELRFQIGGETVIGRAGDTVLAPRRIPHGFRVMSRAGAHFLTITRGGFEAMVRAVARPAEGMNLPRQGVPSPAEQMELAKHCTMNKIDLLGPPIL